MPRQPRIEYAGAVYHVLNRGNYRQDLFTVSGSAARFERVLIDSLRCGVGNCGSVNTSTWAAFTV